MEFFLHLMSDTLKKRTLNALVWSFIDKCGQQLLYFISGIILANLLTPEDYGKIGVLTLFITLSGILVDSGFGSALIRKKKAIRNRLQHDILLQSRHQRFLLSHSFLCRSAHRRFF